MSKTANKIKLVILSFVLIFSILLFLCWRNRVTELQNKNLSKVCFKNICFSVEISDLAKERKKGLMNRKNLDLDKGMFFVFDSENKHGFWMKNTLIPLDIIWIGKENRIVYIKNNAQPCKTEPCEVFYPNEKALYVLEINGEMAEKMGLKIEDIAEFR